MTENETIERCDLLINSLSLDNGVTNAFCDRSKGYVTFEKMREFTLNCKKALEDVQQYRKIGTVMECREAVEKQTAIEPEKVNIPCTSWTKAHMRYRCSCGSFLTSYDDYCNKCGQKLKWGDGK